jgi:hypothetical protein
LNESFVDFVSAIVVLGFGVVGLFVMALLADFMRPRK